MAQFTIYNVGAALGTDTLPSAVNSGGQVTGYFTTSTGAAHAFLWEPLSGALFDRPPLPSFKDCFGFDINDFGQVVGWSDGPSPTGPRHATRWQYSGASQDLGTLGGLKSQAYGINLQGEAVGYAALPNGPEVPVMWDAAGVIHQLESLGGTGVARDINDNGQVIGMSILQNGETHAFLWDKNANPRVADLNVRFGKTITNVGSISDHFITGTFQTPTGNHAFLCDLAANTFTDLAAIGGPGASNGDGVNKSGWAVGIGGSGAFWYNGTNTVDLNTQIIAGTGWQLEEATSIGNQGWITGRGVFNGQPYRGWVLKPHTQAHGGQAIIAEVAQILAGIRAGEGGFEITLAGRVVHIPPHNPDPVWRRILDKLPDAVLRLSTAERNSLFGSGRARPQVRQAAMNKIVNALARALPRENAKVAIRTARKAR